MPTYEYKCGACGKTFELFQSIKAAPVKKCAHCGKELDEDAFICASCGEAICDDCSEGNCPDIA